jgi:hypothetical protein
MREIGDGSPVLPPVMGKLYRDQMCWLGGNVARVRRRGELIHMSASSLTSQAPAPI